MATKRKSINPYSGSGHQVTYDEARRSPKSAAPTKYTTMATPKGRPNQVKVSSEYGAPAMSRTATPRMAQSRTATPRSSVEIRKSNVAKATKRRTK